MQQNERFPHFVGCYRNGLENTKLSLQWERGLWHERAGTLFGGNYVASVNLFSPMGSSDRTRHPLPPLSSGTSDTRGWNTNSNTSQTPRLLGLWLGVRCTHRWFRKWKWGKRPVPAASEVANTRTLSSKYWKHQGFLLQCPISSLQLRSWGSRGNSVRGRSQVHIPKSCRCFYGCQDTMTAVVATVTSWSLEHSKKGVLLNSEVPAVAS